MSCAKKVGCAELVSVAESCGWPVRCWGSCVHCGFEASFTKKSKPQWLLGFLSVVFSVSLVVHTECERSLIKNKEVFGYILVMTVMISLQEQPRYPVP